MKVFMPNSARVSSKNKYGQLVHWIFVANRLAKLIDKKGFHWYYPWLRLKRFSMFSGSYSAVMMSSNGSVMLIKNTEDSYFRDVDDLSALIDLFITKNTDLSFADLIKFSKERGLEIDFKFK